MEFVGDQFELHVGTSALDILINVWLFEILELVLRSWRSIKSKKGKQVDKKL